MIADSYRLFVMGLLLALLVVGCGREGQYVSPDELGEDWPLTVDEGYVDCVENSAHVFKTHGRIYQLNEAARAEGYAPIDPIWNEEMSLDTLNQIASEQC